MSAALAVPGAPIAAGAFCRRAILDTDNVLHGYELADPSASPGTVDWLRSLPDLGVLAGRRPLLLRCAADALFEFAATLPEGGRVILGLPECPSAAWEEPDEPAEPIAQLRARGVRFALPHQALDTMWCWLVQPDLLVVDMRREAVAESVAAIRRVRTQAMPVLATGVHTAALHAAAAAAGAQFFQGHWFEQPMLHKAGVMRPHQALILRLIALLRGQPDVAEVEELLKRDPALGFDLLRFVDSAALGLGRRIESFRAAVMIVGMQRLLRWATVLLATSHPEMPALGHAAVIRGRLMEQLGAQLLPEPLRDDAFTAGVFSLLDAMTSLPLAKVVHGLGLTEPVLDALLRRTGELAPLLGLAEACEAAHEEAFAQYVDQLGLTGHQVNMAHLEALAWAEDLLAMRARN